MHMFLFPKFAAYSFQHFASPLMLYFIRISYVYVSSLAFLLLLISSPISGLVLSISIHYPLIFPGCQLNFGCSTFIKRSVSPEILIDCPSFFFALYHKIPKVSILKCMDHQGSHPFIAISLLHGVESVLVLHNFTMFSWKSDWPFKCSFLCTIYGFTTEMENKL